MSEKEFWEDDPQLYWAYHIFYIKKHELEVEEQKYRAWLNGEMTYIAHTSALRDGFSKSETKGFPTYEELFDKAKNKNKTNKEINEYVEKQNNYWARF